MIEPPQNGISSPVRTMATLGKHGHNLFMYYSNGPTCHGNWLTSVSTPPTILVALLAMPQLQGVETEPDEEVVVVPVTGFVGEGVV